MTDELILKSLQREWLAEKSDGAIGLDEDEEWSEREVWWNNLWEFWHTLWPFASIAILEGDVGSSDG